MKTLIVRYPDNVEAMIISHISIMDADNWNLGACHVSTPMLERGEVEIKTFANVVDNLTGEFVQPESEGE